MTVEKGGKGSHTKREREVARDGSIGCFCERKQLQLIL